MIQSFKTKRQLRCNPVPGSKCQVSNCVETRLSVSLGIMLHKTTRSKSLINIWYKYVNFVQGGVHQARCCRSCEKKKYKIAVVYLFLPASFLRIWQQGLKNWYTRWPATATWYCDGHLSRRWSQSSQTKNGNRKKFKAMEFLSRCLKSYYYLWFQLCNVCGKSI